MWLLLTALALDAQPARLTLGVESAHAVLHIASDTEPRLSASVGTITHLHRESNTSWVADYVPPEETYPQVALVAAVAAAEVAWVAIPLWGQGDAVVETRAHAKISVEIGDQSFGPAEADEDGRALVPVVVPPGVYEAKHHSKRIDLHVPKTPRLHVVLLETEARADQAQTVHVRVLVADDKGAPRPGAQVRLHAGRGEVTAAVERAPGLIEATWTLPAGVAEPVTLSAELDDARGLVSEAGLKLVPGPATVVELKADRDHVVAGEDAEVVLTASARDALGNVSTEPFVLERAGGFGAVTSTTAREWRLRFPEALGERKLAELTVHPKDRPEPRGLVTVRLDSGPATSVSVEPAQVSVRTGQRVELRLQRTDRFGNLAPGEPPSVSAPVGDLSNLVDVREGEAIAVWRAPQRWDREDAAIDVRSGPLAARAEVTLLARLTPLALSPKLGVLSNFARFTSPVIAAEAAFRTDRLGPELALSAELAWAFSSHTQAAGSFSSAEAKDDFVSLALQLAWRRALGARNLAWIGAGPSLVAISSRLTLGAQPTLSESALVPGALLSLGFERRFPSVVPFAELRWSWSKDPALSNLTGAVSALSLLLGGRFELL